MAKVSKKTAKKSKNKKAKQEGTPINEHPLYKSFGLISASPIVMEIKGEMIVFPDAAVYYVWPKSSSEEYKEKLKTTSGFRAITFWSTERGLNSIKAKQSSKWDEIKDDRMLQAIRLKFKQHKGLAKLLLHWNPKSDPLHDPYKREGEPDIIAALKTVRAELKEGKGKNA